MDFTNPKEIISRVKPGYFTDFNAFFTCSSEIDILKAYARCAKRKRTPRLSILIIQLVANLVVAAARETRWLLTRFRNEIRVSSHLVSLARSEEHTSELQSHSDLVCRLLLEKKKKKRKTI